MGPTRLSDGTTISAGNVVELTESAAYARFTNTAARKQFFLEIARAAAADILHGTAGHSRAVAKALGRAVGERRLLVWSRRGSEESRKPLPVDVGAGRSHPTYTVDIEMEPQQSRALVFHLVDPRTTVGPHLLVQPLVGRANVGLLPGDRC